MNRDINIFNKLTRLIILFQRVNQISWTSDQARKRYPAPEAMNKQEMEDLIYLYNSLGLELEKIALEWREIYEK